MPPIKMSTKLRALSAQLAPLLIETQAGEPALLWGGATYPIRPRE